jgi:RNA polymerase-binding transcription factor DksA
MKMSEEFISSQKEILFAEKSRLDKEEKGLKTRPDFTGSTDDNASEAADYENNLSLDEQIGSTSEKVIAALKRIENGTYGTCTKCGLLIEHGRIKVLPSAELCATCEAKLKK